MLTERKTVETDLSEASSEGEIVANQAKLLVAEIKSLNLDQHIRVLSVPEHRDADWYRNRLTLGLVGFEEIPLSILVSSEDRSIPTEQQAVSVVMVSPDSKGSGLLVDPRTKTFLAESFWTCEQGELKHIRPSKPIPLDGIDRSFDRRRGNADLRDINLTGNVYSYISGFKNGVRIALKEASVPVPRGIKISPTAGGHVRGMVDRFFKKHPDISEMVFKSDFDSQGSRILILRVDDESKELVCDVAEKWIERFNWSWVLEERIRPFPASKYATEGIFTVIEPEDYNFRVLATIDPHDPQIIDAEIRYRHDSLDPDEPVNVSIDAKVARLSALGNRELEKKVYETARNAVKAVCSFIKDPQPTLGVSGVDLIFDQQENVYVLEVNGLTSGGFSSLSRLDGKPLTSITDRLIPAYLPILQEGKNSRENIDTVELVRIPHNLSDKRFLQGSRIHRLNEGNS